MNYNHHNYVTVSKHEQKQRRDVAWIVAAGIVTAVILAVLAVILIVCIVRCYKKIDRKELIPEKTPLDMNFLV